MWSVSPWTKGNGRTPITLCLRSFFRMGNLYRQLWTVRCLNLRTSNGSCFVCKLNLSFGTNVFLEMERPPFHGGDWLHNYHAQKLDTSFKMCPPHLTGFNSIGQYKLNRTPHLTPVKHLNKRICLTQPDKKKLFGGKSETELEVYLCAGKLKNHFRREKLHRRFRDISHVQCFTDFNPPPKKSFTKGSENKFSFRASLFLSCQNKGISVNLFMLILFDV